MTSYELFCKEPYGNRVVGVATAGTLAQATRKLYRAHSVPNGAQGYSVQPQRRLALPNAPIKVATHG